MIDIDLYDLLTLIGIVLGGAAVFMGLGVAAFMGYLGGLLVVVGVAGAWRQG